MIQCNDSDAVLEKKSLSRGLALSYVATGIVYHNILHLNLPHVRRNFDGLIEFEMIKRRIGKT